ncbi:hypothetical protein ATI61_105473 [Archangium gephyra]|uniref:Uncharacterized protein n=1 Tax=Archangium gephyra TaxID=48 RepID=A0AAC8TJD6_9BACT|nr:hypothetical protein [Archangium gephyra]AKJ06541.1 Hypothetical protein AA314_08167 [Archangium gephyra]REG32145.1 hypothetical protein ATI61_105473 [Archangium gephyra]
MKRPSFKTLLGNAASLLALAWLYGGDLMDGSRARSAEVSAFLEPPPVVWPAVVLAATVGVLGVVLWGLVRGRGEDFKGYRLLPILLLCALFVDLVRAENQEPTRSEDLAVLVLRYLEEKAEALSDGRTVPSDPAVLQPLLAELEPPPYLVRGQRAAAWSLQVRPGCQGPVREAPGLAVGTLIYCVAEDRKTAWVSLVALPAGERFGLPTVLSVEGQTYVAVVQPTPPEEEEGEPLALPLAPSSKEESAVAPEATDAGALAPAPTP